MKTLTIDELETLIRSRVSGKKTFSKEDEAKLFNELKTHIEFSPKENRDKLFCDMQKVVSKQLNKPIYVKLPLKLRCYKRCLSVLEFCQHVLQRLSDVVVFKMMESSQETMMKLAFSQPKKDEK